jgi:hypothetical protein
MAGRGPSKRWAALLVISILLAGCRSTESRVETVARAVHGWAATTQMTVEALDRGSVPAVYARQVLEAARENRSKYSTEAEWQALPGELRRNLDQAVAQLAATLERSDTRRTQP